MSLPPTWIEMLFKRYNASHALQTGFLLNTTNSFIAEQADAQPNGREELRQAALHEVHSDDLQTVSLALVFLGVVGRPEDLAHVDGMIDHQSDLVRRAARTCRFELQHANQG